MVKNNQNLVKTKQQQKNPLDSRNSMGPKQKTYKETTLRSTIVKLLKTRTVQHAKGSFILYVHKMLHI